MNKTICLLFFVIIFTIPLKSQKITLSSKINNEYNFKISYISTLIYPGFSLGFEKPFSLIQKQKILKNGNNKTKKFENVFHFNVNFYSHTKLHNNLYFAAGFNRYKLISYRFKIDYSISAGYSRTFKNNTTYEIINNEIIEVKNFTGYNYFLFSIGKGFYYCLKNNPSTFYIKFNLIFLYPYNYLIYTRPTIEFGFSYRFKNTKNEN